MSSVGKIRKPIVLRLPASDNFKEWSNYYAPVLEDYYLDFIKFKKWFFSSMVIRGRVSYPIT